MQLLTTTLLVQLLGTQQVQQVLDRNSKGTKNKELAEQFIKYVLDPRLTMSFIEMGGLLSPLVEICLNLATL